MNIEHRTIVMTYLILGWTPLNGNTNDNKLDVSNSRHILCFYFTYIVHIHDFFVIYSESEKVFEKVLEILSEVFVFKYISLKSICI